ncbi:MAG TPA: hypothetical protein PLD60_13550, partial [Leptospiraceae bacterium]|nr:hypothetical protein [Leptospiraceae bacterium]
VQTGSTTSSANGTTTVTISAIDTSTSFLIFQATSAGDRPPGATIGGTIASSTTVDFERFTDGLTTEPAVITIQYYVVTYPSGCASVQRGITNLNADPKNISISSVSSISQAMILFSRSTGTTENVYDSNNITTAYLTSTSNLRIACAGPSNTNAYWQVVDFPYASIRNQSGSTSILGAATSASVPISSVDLSRSIVLTSLYDSGATGNIGANMVRAYLPDSTTLLIERDDVGAPDNLTRIDYQVIEFQDGTTVQRGNLAFSGGASNATLSLANAVDTSASAPFASFQFGPGQSSGKTPYTANDLVGMATATMTLSSTTLSATRGVTGATADIYAYAVQFGK